MTRIVAGTHGGRRLATPSGSRTRPTSERVREAMFSALGARLGGLEGMRVLDLYAGSGALGLEALSRGADHVVLVEADRRTADVVRRNVRELAVGEQVRVVAAKAETTVRGAQPDEPYDLVLLDPPYDLANEEVTAVLFALADNGWLAADALVVVERSSRGEVFAWPTAYEEVGHKRYGETALWYGQPHE